MITCSKLTSYLNTLLDVKAFSDYAPNGLQVQGKSEIKKIVTGVSASQALLDAAVALNADAILVHHGYFWRGEDPCLVGIARQRIATLLKHDINLLAYHLPLDAHAELGNNAQLAKRLDIQIEAEFSGGEKPALGRLGQLTTAMSGDDLKAHVQQQLQREPLYIRGRCDVVKKIAWCTGAAQDLIQAAASYGVDAFITGEVSERTVHIARETGIHFYAAGHHATERYGVMALAQHIATTFDVESEFVDIANPV